MISPEAVEAMRVYLPAMEAGVRALLMLQRDALTGFQPTAAALYGHEAADLERFAAWLDGGAQKLPPDAADLPDVEMMMDES